MSECRPEWSGEISGQGPQVTFEATTFDGLQEFLENRSRSEAEVLSIISNAMAEIKNLGDDDKSTEALEELVAIALEYGIEPEVVLEIAREQGIVEEF